MSKAQTRQCWKLEIQIAATELCNVPTKVYVLGWGPGEVYGDTRGGKLALVVGLVLKYSVPKIQLVINNFVNHGSQGN